MTALASADVEPEREGRVIARKYRLEGLLGEGGMGSIWRAYNLQLELPVAIKLMRPGLQAPELGERLRVEARAAAKLVHPSIVRVFDIGETESGEPFIVMELLHGESLGQMLERGALPAVNALQLLLPIAEALSLAHSRGVVHRDLKPDNIFVTSDAACPQPKLLDFGIAKVRSQTLAGGPTLTRAGMLLGSPEYMSPEQAHGRSDIDERSDVWAFCVVLYEAIAGRAPFEGENCTAILHSVIKCEPLALSSFGDVDPALAALIHGGLSKDRDARPATIFDLGRKLAEWLFERGILEDAAGSSLEAKWLGRPSETVSLISPRRPHSAHAHHEQVTLVSVVQPSREPSQPLFGAKPAPKRRRWTSGIIVLSSALAGCIGWASVRQLQASGRLSGLVGSTELPRANVAAASPARAPAVAVDAPIVVAPALQTTSPAPTEGLAPRPSFAARASAATKTLAPPAAPRAATSALPRALPNRENGVELINPY